MNQNNPPHNKATCELLANGVGWATFTCPVKNSSKPFIMNASWVSNVPADILRATLIAKRHDKPFYIGFDAEERGDWDITATSDSVIATTMCGTYELDITKDALIQQLVSAIETDLENWAKFDAFDDADVAVCRRNLKSLLTRYKHIGIK